MPSKKAHAELKIGDKVSIPGEGLLGTLSAIHPHEVTVKLESGEHRHYPHESIRREATLDELSNFFDH